MEHERLQPSPPARLLGQLIGQIWVSPDFDEPDAELEALFEGSELRDC